MDLARSLRNLGGRGAAGRWPAATTYDDRSQRRAQLVAGSAGAAQRLAGDANGVVDRAAHLKLLAIDLAGRGRRRVDHLVCSAVRRIRRVGRAAVGGSFGRSRRWVVPPDL